jgi:hypothetical protein
MLTILLIQLLVVSSAVSVNQGVNLAVIGDYGLDGPDEARVARMVRENQESLRNLDAAVLTLGDNSYSGDYSKDVRKHYGALLDSGRFFPCPWIRLCCYGLSL